MEVVESSFVGPCTPFLVIVDFIDSRFLESDTKFLCFLFLVERRGTGDCIFQKS